MKPHVLIYRDEILNSSETFIINQALSLSLFAPYLIGSRTVLGLHVPEEIVRVINGGGIVGRVEEVFHKLWGGNARFIKSLRPLHPVLVHAHFGPDGLRALPIARELKIPLIVTFHGFDATVSDDYAKKSFYGHRKYASNKMKLAASASRLIAVSNFIKSKLIAQGYESSKIIVHYIGVDTKFFSASPGMTRERIVLFVGRLVDVKGCSHLINAMQRLNYKDPTIKLVVIGDGPLRSELETQAKRLRVNVEFLGRRTPEEVKLWMNRAKVFCVPSLTMDSGAAEGLGMVFAEAQSMGLPVVSSKVGGIPEVVIHGNTGFLVEERDADAISSYIYSILEDCDLWKRLSESGKQHIRKNFDLTTQTKKLEQIYTDVVHGSPIRAR